MVTKIQSIGIGQKKFMQVGIDVTCMHTNFGGRDFSGFGDKISLYRIAGIFRRSLISFFSFSFFLNEFIQNENLM